jgi:hypothetical protein
MNLFFDFSAIFFYLKIKSLVLIDCYLSSPIKKRFRKYFGNPNIVCTFAATCSPRFPLEQRTEGGRFIFLSV